MENQFADFKTSKMLTAVMPINNDMAFFTVDDEKFHLRSIKNEGFGREVVPCLLWQQIEEALWEKHHIVIQVGNISSHVGGYSDFEFETTIEGEYGLSIDYIDCFACPITAKIEGIKKAVEHLYREVAVEAVTPINTSANGA